MRSEMEIFLTGATGYIGGVVAEALQRRGHRVTGLARSDEAARQLESRGIRPVPGDLYGAGAITGAARSADGTIHAAATNGPDAPQADKSALEAILGALARSGKAFIYTSGIWVLGNTGERIADEESSLDPAPLVAWRPEHEQMALRAAATGVRSIVIRPAIVYGRGGGLINSFIKSAQAQGAASFIGDGENRWPLVHVDDLADLYVRALEQAPPGTLLLAANGPAMRVKEIAERASRSAGAGGRIEAWPLEEARKQLGPYADALALDQQVTAARARELLQWSPASPSLAAELESGAYTGR